MTIANKQIRIISGYGPQENWAEAERMPFFIALEEEIIKAELAGKSVFIELDANSKLGPDVIAGDMHKQSENGKVLAAIIERNGLLLGNNIKQCTGLVTRKRVTKNSTEESIIDFVIMSADLENDVESILIDDAREHVLTKIARNKSGITKVESDHNVIFSKLKLSWNKSNKENRTEIFNLKNKDCQEIFNNATKAVNNDNYLSSVFDTDEGVDIQTQKFLARLNKTIAKCFKKVRVAEKVDKNKVELFKKWQCLKNKTDEKSKADREKLEEELANEYAEEYYEKIKEKTADIDCEDGGIISGQLWNLKKEIFPKSREPPTAMIDPINGNMLTSSEKIEKAAINVYSKRLENRPMKEELTKIKDAKELLCKKLLELAKTRKTPAWTMKQLEVVLKNLKRKKSRDPLGLANEIFHPGVAGDDLKLAILKLMNKIKDEQIYPKCLELCNISSIWKRKGSRNDFDSYRGVFRLTVFRSILDRLIYNDEYEKIDGNLSDCNVGARKRRNIRDNIFVINAITNSIKNNREEALDVQVYDVEKCFDALWLHEVINCLYESGLQNDKLPLLFLENNNAQVAVKSNGNISTRVNIKDLIMQGSVWGSLCCVVLMEKLGKMIYKNKDLLYYYKGLVGTPPLQMVDDVLGVQRCSQKSLKLNKSINTFIDLEKLTLSKTKCRNVHIGNQKISCPQLKIDGGLMKSANQETYLGDIIEKSGNIRPNIEKRRAKGYGMISDILAIVNELPLGHWRTEAGLRLRQAMLVNGTLFNTEAWHGITKKDVEVFEKVDEALLRALLNAHSKIPIEALYLETKSNPIRYIIASRRLMYLHSILQKKEDELVRKVYEAQKADPTPGDFTELLKEDKESISIDLTDNEIQMMSKIKFKNYVKEKIETAAFSYLLDRKQKHSKMSRLTYEKFEISKYLSSPIFNTESRILLLAMRTRTVNGVRCDFPGLYQDRQCPLYCGKDDTLDHILTCSVLRIHHTSYNLATDTVKFEDIFSTDIYKQKEIVELYRQLLDLRAKLLSSQPVATTGPVHCV